MATVTVRKDYSVALPAAIRKRLAVKPGDKVEIKSGPNGEAVLRAVRDPLEESFGIWADRKDMKDSVEWVNRLRDEWRVREEHILGSRTKRASRRYRRSH